ncbi:hypothetical protein [Streptomyces sp. NPDC014733]|uniref:hypothetical protein n=1 Tax=Streptomyces sp. NPDC014733 TaxID=3364885 RepID=UPI0036F9D17F
MAERGECGVVLTRWPNAISPTPELQYPELDHLGGLNVQLFFTWSVQPPVVRRDNQVLDA